MNNIIILQHQKPCAFLQSISSTWPPLFGLNLKNWYLSKTISFLKCPLVPTFLLIEARRCHPKMEMFCLKDLFTWEFFVIFFPHSCPHLSLISINTTEGHMWNCIIFFYIFIFLKKKKWNGTRWEQNLVLNNEMRMNDMKTKPCI